MNVTVSNSIINNAFFRHLKQVIFKIFDWQSKNSLCLYLFTTCIFNQYIPFYALIRKRSLLIVKTFLGKMHPYIICDKCNPYYACNCTIKLLKKIFCKDNIDVLTHCVDLEMMGNTIPNIAWRS
jgi:hypothetical protein